MQGSSKNGLTSVIILFTALLLAFFCANAVVVRTGALEGISLTDYLADEFRIWLLSPPSQGRTCRINSTALEPLCIAEERGYQVRIPTSTMSINSIGLRDKEYSLEKAAGTYRIFVAGDSFSFGVGVNDGETFSDVLEEMLNARYNGTLFEVFNLGIPGADIGDEYSRLRGYMDYSPDMLILQSHTNDIHGCTAFKDELDRIIDGGENAVAESPQQGQEAQLSREKLREKIALGMEKGRRCACILGALSSMLGLTLEREIPLLAYDIDTPDEYACLDDVNASGYHYMKAQKRIRIDFVSRKDTHPNREGHLKMAEELFTGVTSVINSTRPELLK